MKTKRYEFTEIEVLALKEATTEFYHFMKQIKAGSPIVMNMKAALCALKNQFHDDYRLWKE